MAPGGQRSRYFAFRFKCKQLHLWVWVDGGNAMAAI